MLTAFVAGCTRTPPPQPAARPDLIVLVIDALRPDHLGSHGYARPTSPNLDRLAERGARFEHAMSAANYTTASVPSIFTGLFPSVHGVFAEGDRLDDGFLTLAERLRDLSYATAAFAPNPSLGRRFNFDQGFDLFDDKALHNEETIPWKKFETAERIRKGALSFVDGVAAEKPVFLYLHYRDVHGPYVPPPPFDRVFVDAAVESAAALSAAQREAIPEYLRLEGAPATLAHYLAQYDGEILYTDGRIGALLEALESRGRLRHAWIVVTADHGESFLDHGVWNHGNELYQEEIHVPLILVAPQGRGRGRRIGDLVSGVDLLPTLLEAAGAPPPAGVQGRSLLPLLDGARLPRTTLFAEGRGRLAVRDGRFKLLRDADAGVWRQFDLAADPGERVDLRASPGAPIARLQEAGRRFLAESRALAAGRPRTKVAIDADLERELRTLGYLP